MGDMLNLRSYALKLNLWKVYISLLILQNRLKFILNDCSKVHKKCTLDILKVILLNNYVQFSNFIWSVFLALNLQIQIAWIMFSKFCF